jgi:flagellar motor switch protein FliN/FliY
MQPLLTSAPLCLTIRSHNSPLGNFCIQKREMEAYMPEHATTPDFQIVEDVTVELRAELDKRTTTFGELLNLDVGSILQLSRTTGDNVDLLAGEVLIACGEILVIESTLAVRVAEFRRRLANEVEK